MRLAAVEKMGYYPTPPSIFPLIAKWLVAPSGQPWRLLDPCCGKGEAAALAELVGGECESWGVEISPARAEEAAQRLTRVHNTAWQGVRAYDVSLLYLNPPYDDDYDGSEKRVEIEFLRTGLEALPIGGILVYVVPQRALGFQAVARMLAGYFDDLVIRRFPDGEYERFNQIVVLGRRRQYVLPNPDDLQAVNCLTDEQLQPLDEPPAPWPLPILPSPAKANFRRVDVTKSEKIARAHAVGWPEDLLNAMQARERIACRPAMPLKKGHVAMMMASGLMGTMRLGRMLVKGRVVKRQEEYEEEDDKGRKVSVTRDKFTTSVGIIAPDGVRVVEDVQGLTEFMEEHGEEVAAEILKNRPLYDLQPTDEEWAVVSSLGLRRRPLPGQKQPGLLDMQKHAAIANARALRTYGVATDQGEMGIGKTSLALATIELLGAYPALVLCPPHLCPKWMREAREVIPGVQTRELKRIGKKGDREVNDVRAFLEDYRRGLLGEKAIAVVASTSAKMGSKWTGAVMTRYRLPLVGNDGRKALNAALQTYQRERDKLLVMLKPERMQIIIDRQRQRVLDAKGTGQYEPEKARLRRMVRIKHRPQETIEEQRARTRKARKAALALATPYPVCPICGQMQVERVEGAEVPILAFRPFSKKVHACDRPVAGWAMEEDGRRAKDDHGNPVWVWCQDEEDEKKAPRCGSPLYSFGGPEAIRRWPIADYIHDHAKGFFQILVADEVHEYKGKSSDRGLAFARLVKATRYQLGLTGTFYGGVSTSVFWLMHRLAMGAVNRDFPYNGERKWTELYGVLEKRIYGGKDQSDDADEYGTFNATKRTKVYVREKPGVSPAILGRLISNTLFLALKDLGVVLPPYSEEMALVEMDKEQRAQYITMEDGLRARARKDSRFLSTWLQWSLGRPNSGFRDEVVVKKFRDDDGHVVNTEILDELAAVVTGDELLPKEQWLIDYCNAEKAVGRKVLVYVRQTAKRDIQPRLQAVLQKAGLRVKVLNSGVGTRKREAWIERHSAGIDVLVVNPRLVQTGLDLVQFCTVVFCEMEYSLYTMWQAMRRVWRLGQTKPVKVVFTAYSGTLEEDAVALMGSKMRAAQLLYGDEVGGAIVPDEDGNFLTQLARAVLDEQDLPDLHTLFAAAEVETSSPMGSPTAKSPLLPVYTAAQLRAMWQAEREARGNKGRARVAEQIAAGQMSIDALLAPAT
jgi:SAM-dependent methyltransferase